MSEDGQATTAEPEDEIVDGEALAKALKEMKDAEDAALGETPEGVRHIDWPKPNPGPNPTRVAIIGKGPSRGRAPWGAEGWELWGLNECYEHRSIPPIESHTRWFQLHPPRYLRKHYKPGLEDLNWEWVRDRGVRLYMDAIYSVYPNSEAYPRAAVEALTEHGYYHASSFDWMVALAVLDRFKEIHLFGCEFYTFPQLNSEPISGRPCLEYWLGVAEGRGIKVRLCDRGDVFKVIHMAKMQSAAQYGFQNEPALDLQDFGWTDVR